MADVTQILSQIESGNSRAAEQLLPLVYNELRKLAAVRMAQEKPGQTLQATALVHEAYMRLVGAEQGQSWDSRGHFFSAAAEAMRRILVERARKQNRRDVVRGLPISLEELASPLSFPCDQLLLLDEAMQRLERSNEEAAAVVKLRFFAGMTMKQSADALGLSLRTAERSWTFARAWLRREIEKLAASQK